MAHYARLIAAGVYPNPVPHAICQPRTTHKKPARPRGGVILMKAEFREADQFGDFPAFRAVR